jgi:hypothetical protein
MMMVAKLLELQEATLATHKESAALLMDVINNQKAMLACMQGGYTPPPLSTSLVMGPSEGGLATASELQPSQPHMSWQEGVQPSSEVPQTHPQPASSSQAPPSGPSEGGLATASKLQPQTQARRKRVAFQRQTGPGMKRQKVGEEQRQKAIKELIETVKSCLRVH